MFPTLESSHLHERRSSSIPSGCHPGGGGSARTPASPDEMACPDPRARPRLRRLHGSLALLRDRSGAGGGCRAPHPCERSPDVSVRWPPAPHLRVRAPGERLRPVDYVARPCFLG